MNTVITITPHSYRTDREHRRVADAIMQTHDLDVMKVKRIDGPYLGRTFGDPDLYWVVTLDESPEHDRSIIVVAGNEAR